MRAGMARPADATCPCAWHENKTSRFEAAGNDRFRVDHSAGAVACPFECGHKCGVWIGAVRRPSRLDGGLKFGLRQNKCNLFVEQARGNCGTNHSFGRGGRCVIPAVEAHVFFENVENCERIPQRGDFLGRTQSCINQAGCDVVHTVLGSWTDAQCFDEPTITDE